MGQLLAPVSNHADMQARPTTWEQGRRMARSVVKASRQMLQVASSGPVVISGRWARKVVRLLPDAVDGACRSLLLFSTRLPSCVVGNGRGV